MKPLAKRIAVALFVAALAAPAIAVSAAADASVNAGGPIRCCN